MSSSVDSEKAVGNSDSSRRLPREIWVLVIGAFIIAVGMGIVSPTLSTQLLKFAPVSDQGRITAASSLTASVAQAVALAVAGALIAWQAPALPGWLFAGVMVASAAVTLKLPVTVAPP